MQVKRQFYLTRGVNTTFNTFISKHILKLKRISNHNLQRVKKPFDDKWGKEDWFDIEDVVSESK